MTTTTTMTKNKLELTIPTKWMSSADLAERLTDLVDVLETYKDFYNSALVKEAIRRLKK